MGLLNAVLGRDDPPEEVIENCKVDIKVMFSEVDLKEGEAWIETEYGFLFWEGVSSNRGTFCYRGRWDPIRCFLFTDSSTAIQ